MFESIGAAKYITTLDLAKGYCQRLFEFTVMQFGLHSAPATFQWMINKVLRGCQSYAKAYIDNIVIFSQTREEHLDHLKKLFRLPQANLFCRRQTSYLGHVIGQGRIEPAHDKVAAILNYPRPANKKEVRAFLRLAGYYRRFVRDFSTIVAPLTRLT